MKGKRNTDPLLIPASRLDPYCSQLPCSRYNNKEEAVKVKGL